MHPALGQIVNTLQQVRSSFSEPVNRVLIFRYRVHVEPLLAGVESLSERIREYNERIEQLAQQSYPQVALPHVYGPLSHNALNQIVSAISGYNNFSKLDGPLWN
jgi:hypothetical protein